MTNVPAQYQDYVNRAASELGIPAAVVAAQINLESGFNPNARSYAGAEGIAQFLPSTFRAYGSGSPYNVTDAFNAYVNFMKSLLNDFHGDLRKALAAYNAGPGNIGAGMGYANKILSAAGTGDITTGSSSGGGTSGGSGGGSVQQASLVNDLGILGGFGGLVTGTVGQMTGGAGDIANVLVGIVNDLSTAIRMFSILIKPSFWLRVGAFFVGILFLSMGTLSLYGSVKK
jgi:hypothetical protein